MSYGRNPHYIYSTGEHLVFSGVVDVPEYLINAFLYKLLLSNRRDELSERLRNGKEEWLKKLGWENPIDFSNRESIIKSLDTENRLIEITQDADYMQWMESQEDEILKKLMGIE